MTHEIDARLGRIRDIRLHRLPELHRPVLDRASHRHTVPKPLQPIRAALHAEVRKRDLVRVPRDDCWHAVVLRGDGGAVNVELEVAAVVELGPLELAVRGYERRGGVDAGGEGDVLAVGRGGGDR